jgi:peptidoglycan/xylan/chitin deacetylase (PgdA/CDA1 family)
VDRRAFLYGIPLGALAVLTGCTDVDGARPSASAGGPGGSSTNLPSASPTPPPPTLTPTPTPTAVSAPRLTKVPLPRGAITGLPGTGDLLAWTVDDGIDADVVEKYVEFAAATGTRLTFFLNGDNPSWTIHADILRPLVDSGQVQLGNHTWDHPNLTRLSDSNVIGELQRNHNFIKATYGVDARPYFRPPFGFHDARVDRFAASIGYTTPVLWYGSLSDSGLITPAQVVQFATEWFLPQHIVIGHANFEPVTTVFPQLESLIRRRHLQTVTLNDVFVRP